MSVRPSPSGALSLATSDRYHGRRLIEYISYDRFAIQPSQNRILFSYSCNDQTTFQTSVGLQLDGWINEQNWPFLQATAFSIGLCLASYIYVAFCPPVVRVRAGALDAGQIAFWEDLYNQGLLEHFYVHGIPVRDGIAIVNDAPADRRWPRLPGRPPEEPRVLASLGLGKDSAVMIELLRECGLAPVWSYFEEYPGELASCRRYMEFMKASGQPEVLLATHDYLSRDEVRLSARYEDIENYVLYPCLYAFSGAFQCILHGFNHIAVGNERSANFRNLIYEGRGVNHQYEKSLPFERALDRYIASYLAEDLRYFSPLMHLWELQVVSRFCSHPQYHRWFMSCNQPNMELWCNRCPKCLQTYLFCSAFMDQAEVMTIFGKNLLEEEAFLPMLRQMLRLEGHKPLECLATPEENRAAMHLAAMRWPAGRPLPLLLARHQAHLESWGSCVALLSDSCAETNQPDWFTRGVTACQKPEASTLENRRTPSFR